MNRMVNAEDKEIFLDIYEDLAKDVGTKLNWDMRSYSRQYAKDKTPFPAWCFLTVGEFGKEHPKFPLIARYFQETEVRAVDCRERRDCWATIVRMLDDTKHSLSEADRKELYQDLRDLIGHRLARKEY